MDVLEARGVCGPFRTADFRALTIQARVYLFTEGLLRELQLHVSALSPANLYAFSGSTIL